MKYTKYSKYVADLADEMSMEDLLSALSDYMLESGFQSDSMYFQQMDEHSLDALRQAIQQALEMGEFLDDEMRERLEQMQADGTMEEPALRSRTRVWTFLALRLCVTCWAHSGAQALDGMTRATWPPASNPAARPSLMSSATP